MNEFPKLVYLDGTEPAEDDQEYGDDYEFEPLEEIDDWTP